jgi:Fic-DOC domain mobile mystery protein B
MPPVDVDPNPGNTPLTPNEQALLIPNLATKAELNEFERLNIIEARDWALNPRVLRNSDPFSEPYLRDLHRRMFNNTWRWAGTYRNSDKNIGVPFHDIRNRIPALLGNARYWVEHHTYDIDEVAVRVHHESVLIHPFPNGNGRHARLLADVIAVKFGRPEFTWGPQNMQSAGPTRDAYLEALRKADQGDIRDLLTFSRS